MKPSTEYHIRDSVSETTPLPGVALIVSIMGEEPIVTFECSFLGG
jgi:hypothetical protein